MAPQVSWDGEQLSISTNNSTLGAVLDAVREKTGAYVDIPAGAANDRIAVQLGPAPAREVLSTLLAGTDFDYVIQASEDDVLGVQSILLTRRTKPNSATHDGNAPALAASRRDKYQRFIGTRFPDQSTGQSEAPADSSSDSSSSLAEAIDSKNAAQLPAPPDSKATTREAEAPAEAAAKSPASGSGQPAAPSPVPEASPVQAEVASVTNQTPDAQQPDPFQQKIMDMQSLFEQRKQMQAQSLKTKDNN